MENILQSIVKIIIIGCTCAAARGNRQFLTAPLPYYPSENFYLPSFVPPYQEPSPVYYRAQNPPPVVPISPEFRNSPPIPTIPSDFRNSPPIPTEFSNPPPISYQNVNSYSPPLFRQNENYNPANFPTPSVRYPVPPIFQYKTNTYQPYKPPQFPPNNFKKTSLVQATISTEGNQKKPGFYQTNIIVKDETHPPFYEDDYNKNYHDDDYSDNYSEEAPSVPEPCLSGTPYRYFRSRKENPVDKLPLCNPHFQPNFGNSLYTVRMPITLLPSRFPPRVEQLIERIQNYFSTYTQQQNGKPQNETSTAATVAAVTEATSQSSVQPTATAVDQDNKKNKTTEVEELAMGQDDKRNKTTEIVELALEETNPEPSELPPVPTVSENVPQKTIVVEIEEDKAAQANKEPVMATQSAPHPTGDAAASTAAQIPEVTTQRADPAAEAEGSDKSSENQISKEWDKSRNVLGGNPEPQAPAAGVPLTESPVTEKRSAAEETFTLPTTTASLLQVSDTNG